MAAAAPALAPGAPANAADGEAALAPRPQPAFRYWIDELLWSQGHVACETLEELLVRMGGERAGGPPKASLPPGAAASSAAASAATGSEDGGGGGAAAAGRPSGGGPIHPLERYLGCRHVDQWDLLWSKSVYALRAARAMKAPGGGSGSAPPPPPGAVSAVAGLNCLTMKKRLVRALRLAYGPRAWLITPRSFELPEQLAEWRAWVATRGALRQALQAGGGGATAAAPSSSSPPDYDHDAAAEEEDLWILKTGQDAGKGLSLLPAERAVAAAAAQASAAAGPRGRASSLPSAAATTHAQQQAHRRLLKVAQLYVRDPLLVRGRKFHLRLWVLVTGCSPLRAFLHDEGLVLFSSEPYDAGAVAHLLLSSQPGGQGQQHQDGRREGAVGRRVGGGAGAEADEEQEDESKRRVVALLAARARAAGAGPSSAAASAAATASAAAAATASSLPPPPASHITNFARNEGTWVWTLDDLARELGPEAWQLLRGRVARATAATVAASLPSLHDAHRWLGPPPVEHYGFQLVGFDYLVDSRMRPWLLEVNSAPSIMAVHSDARIARLVRSAKQAALGAMLEMARPRFDAAFAAAAMQAQGGALASSSSSPSSAGGGAGGVAADAAAGGGSGLGGEAAAAARAGRREQAEGEEEEDGEEGGAASSSSWRSLADHEMASRAGFRPLAPLFASCGARVPWTARDRALWRRMEERHGSTVESEWPEMAALRGEEEEEGWGEGSGGGGHD
jgi:hypothetical protein